ncbi:hypothetical protein JNK13_01320 [bacterium]|nr:hypothetical protein [bacterium]
MHQLTPDIEKYLQVTDIFAKSARKLILDFWHANRIEVDLKSDNSPVTEVDMKCEAMLREEISKKFPDHGIIGEEYGVSNPDSEFQWVIDPIDGTQNLVNRIPTFGSMIALRFQGKSIVGSIDHPALDCHCIGALGQGVYFAGQRQTIIDTICQPSIAPNEIIATSTLATFKRNDRSALFYKILELHANTRIYYDCYATTLAVTGRLGALVECNLKLWDIAPAEILAQEAGGKFCYFQTGDQPQYYNSVFGKPAVVDKLLTLSL